MFRKLRFLLLLSAAVGVPYVWSNQELLEQAKGKLAEWREGKHQFDWSTDVDSLWGAGETVAIDTPAFSPAIGASHARPDSEPGSFGFAARPASFEELLRFDITPRWVSTRWPRVSTVPSDTNLVGMRVAVVTGTAIHDVAGSLTYYFDDQQRLMRITLHGETGDDLPLTQFVNSRFNLRSEPALGARTFVARWNGRPMSSLRISHAPVVRADAPRERLRIELELNHPDWKQPLSPASAPPVVEPQKPSNEPFWRRTR